MKRECVNGPCDGQLVDVAKNARGWINLPIPKFLGADSFKLPPFEQLKEPMFKVVRYRISSDGKLYYDPE